MWARRLGHYAWFEQRMFELLGTWSARCSSPELCTALARHARHRATHAEGWHRLLPEVSHRPRVALVVPAGDGAGELFARLANTAAQEPPSGSQDRLRAVHAAVAHAGLAAYAEHRDLASVVAEGPTRRVLDLVIGEQTADLAESDALIRVAGDAAPDRGVDPQLSPGWQAALFGPRWRSPDVGLGAG